MAQASIGVIGGSGLYKMEALKEVQEIRVDTPFGSPSDALILGNLEGTQVAFLAVVLQKRERQVVGWEIVSVCSCLHAQTEPLQVAAL